MKIRVQRPKQIYINCVEWSVWSGHKYTSGSKRTNVTERWLYSDDDDREKHHRYGYSCEKTSSNPQSARYKLMCIFSYGPVQSIIREGLDETPIYQLWTKIAFTDPKHTRD